jgi:ParB-like chromosome segregation protein Spo0J
MSAFETTNPQDLFYAKNDLERVNNLAKQIKNNGYIDPLIVAVDESGPYVLEGAHRLGALHTLGVEDIPAMVVRDLGD